MIVSEITKLTQVLLHKPLYALRYLTPQNCQEYLFDDVLWVEKADEEHDYFEWMLRNLGIKVHLLHELLEQTLQNPLAREWLFNRRLTQLQHHALIKEQLLVFLNGLTAEEAARYLLGGLLFSECDGLQQGLAHYVMQPHDFLIPPLPNHLFIRDSSSWIGKGVVISSMKYAVRRGEALNLAAIYKFHPLFCHQKPSIWYDGSEDRNMPNIEGGDLLVMSADTLLVGISQRTSVGAVELLAQSLFKAGEKKQVIAVLLPSARLFMHLDVMMTMVREDTFVSAFPEGQPIQAWRILPSDSAQRIVVEPIADYYQAIADALQVDRLRLISPGGDYFAVQREQWSDSANLLAIAPGEVIAYDRNQEMNRKLRAAGIKVHEIPGSELSRGRGGARCMSCPLVRSER